MSAKKEKVTVYLTIKRGGMTLMEERAYQPMHPSELVLEEKEWQHVGLNMSRAFSWMMKRFDKKYVTSEHWDEYEKECEEFDKQCEMEEKEILSQE